MPPSVLLVGSWATTTTLLFWFSWKRVNTSADWFEYGLILFGPYLILAVALVAAPSAYLRRVFVTGLLAVVVPGQFVVGFVFATCCRALGREHNYLLLEMMGTLLVVLVMYAVSSLMCLFAVCSRLPAVSMPTEITIRDPFSA
jgi:hypothetical protein